MNLNKITNYLFLTLLVLSFCKPLHAFGKIQDLKQAISKKICRYRNSQKTLDMYFLAAVFKCNLEDAKFYHESGANINAINNYAVEEWMNFASKTEYISSGDAILIGCPSFQIWQTGLLFKYSPFNDKLIQNARLIIKYLISLDASVYYYTASCDTINGPQLISVFNHPVFKTNKDYDRYRIILLRYSTKLTQEDIDALNNVPKIDYDSEEVINKSILNFIEQINLRRKKIDKNLRINHVRKALQNTNILPNVLVDLTGEYIEGEIEGEEEKKSREEVK